MDFQHQRERGNLDDWRKICLRVIRQALVQGRVHGHGPACGQQDRVAVRGGFGNDIRSDIAARTGTVLHHYRHAKPRLKAGL
ncbi:hypothetical protein D3C81_2199780 [compost metagenome]